MGKPCGLDWSHLADAFVSQNVVRVSDIVVMQSDVRKLDADAILFREFQCKKWDILTLKCRFQCRFGWNQVKYVPPNSLVFKQHLQDPANVNA